LILKSVNFSDSNAEPLENGNDINSILNIDSRKKSKIIINQNLTNSENILQVVIIFLMA